MNHSCDFNSRNQLGRTAGSNQRNRGFTLVELLMVIVVISILASLLLVASMSIIGTSREAATKATLTKVHGMLKERLSIFSGHKTDPVQIASVLLIADSDSKRAEVLARKIEYLRAFPQTWAEAVRAGMLPKEKVPYYPSVSPFAITESSEVLYFVLTSSNSLGMTPVDTDSFTSNEVKDTDNNGRPEFVDGWGRPLRFYRWPTRLVRNGALGPSLDPKDRPRAKLLLGDVINDDSQLTKDPDDPIGLLTMSSWSTLNTPANSERFEDGPLDGAATASEFDHSLSNDKFHTLGTYHVPLIVSSGADAELGLFEPNQNSNPMERGYLAQTKDPNNDAPLYDNLTNYNFRSGGN